MLSWLNTSTGSDTQVLSCSNECKESYANIKRLYDIQKEKLSDASVEIKAYTNESKKSLSHSKLSINKIILDNPHRTLKNKGIIDSGCSRHMTGNKAYLADFQDYNGGPIAFGGSKGYITGKGKIKTGKLDFEDLPDENQILLKVPRQNNMYSFNLENIVPLGGLACLIAKATTDESNLWHRRLGHVNFKNLNRLVKGNLVRGLPTKLFLNDHTCVACQKGKQHKASCKAKPLGQVCWKNRMRDFGLWYSLQSKAFRVYNLATKRVEENLHINFLENKPNVVGKGPSWLFDLDYLTDSMNYDFVRSENQASIHAGQEESNQHTGTKDKIDAGDSEKEDESSQDAFELPIWLSYSSTNHCFKSVKKIGGPKERKNKVFRMIMLRLQRRSCVCACSRFSVTPKTSAFKSAVKNEFLGTLKGRNPNGLWFYLETLHLTWNLSDSEYVGANLDRKSTTGGCQFLGRRLITWQCKKQTIVATSTTEAEYVAAASCCGQVLWIQNQMLDYGFNFMNTKIYIDNESTICIVKNPVYHSKTKHIAIRHHFIRDAYEKKLIQVLKIHTDDNVADLLTKAFDVSRFQFLVVSIGMINP
ncbi:ribonuclease H-like domain-containing protein [Tanacetum coccineum]